MAELEAPDRARYVPCPVELVGEPWESMWQEAQGQLRDQGTWRVTDAPMLHAMIELRRQAATARREGAAEPIVIGSTGQPSANPLLAVADRAESLAAQLADRLMLTAKARTASERDGGKADDGAPGDEFAGLEGIKLEPAAGAKAKRRRK